MATLDSRYTINGLVDTSRTALDNMTSITNSCNTWLSYDALVGKWAVAINRAGNAEVAFNDSNIIGPINLTTTDLTSYYNSCEVRFHNFDLRDREDYALLEIPAEQRLPNEPDNRLIINAPMVNNQIQAQLLGLIELKQSRLDQVIEFDTDFSFINIEAGTIISVTNTVYGYTDKLFRVLQMSETQDTTITITITAQEYDEDIYNEDDLYEYLRETETGLIELDPLVDVSPVTDSTAVVDDTGSISPLLAALPLLLSLLDGVNAGSNNAMTTGIFDSFTAKTGKDLITSDVFFSSVSTQTANSIQTKLDAQTAGSDAFLIYNGANVLSLSNRISFQFSVAAGFDNLEFEIQTPTVGMDYYAKIQDGTDVLFTDVLAQPAFTLEVYLGNTLATANVIAASTVDWTSNYSKLVVPSPAAGTYFVTLFIIPTYDLNMYWPTRGAANTEPNYVYFNNFDVQTSATVTATTSIQ